MFGIGGTNHIGMGADLQAKHGDDEFLGKMDEAWHYLTRRMGSDPGRTACIGHCMGGRLLIPFAADHPQVKAIVLYYPSVRDEPETSHRPRHAFKLAPTLKCATLVFAGGLDYIATPAIQAPLWEAFRGNNQPVEWHYFSDANHGFRHPDNAGFQPHYAGCRVAAGDGLPPAAASDQGALCSRPSRMIARSASRSCSRLMSVSGSPSTRSRSAR
jgi:dienelactone hydrolase